MRDYEIFEDELVDELMKSYEENKTLKKELHFYKTLFVGLAEQGRDDIVFGIMNNLKKELKYSERELKDKNVEISNLNDRIEYLEKEYYTMDFTLSSTRKKLVKLESRKNVLEQPDKVLKYDDFKNKKMSEMPKTTIKVPNKIVKTAIGDSKIDEKKNKLIERLQFELMQNENLRHAILDMSK